MSTREIGPLIRSPPSIGNISSRIVVSLSYLCGISWFVLFLDFFLLGIEQTTSVVRRANSFRVGHSAILKTELVT
jgi:hypothetical protein